MSLDKSKKTTKSIQELRKELFEMHKQFDNVINSSTSLKNEETLKPTTKESVELTTDDNDSFALLDISESSSSITSTDKKELQSKEVNDKTIHLDIDNNNNNNVTNEISQDKVSEIKNNDKLNESYLSIKDKLENIKNDIKKKETEINKKKGNLGELVDEQKTIPTTKKRDAVTKTIPKTKESDFHKTKLKLKSDGVEKNKKATILTVVILIILILASAYLILQ